MKINVFLGSSVKCVDAFRIAIKEKTKLLIKQKTWLRRQLSILLSSTSLKTFSFSDSKISADKDLKNHYISSKKTSINNGKITYKKQVCNHKEIN